MTTEQSFFAVFCIEALADELHIAGDEIYHMLAASNIFDGYILQNYELLHTQGRSWIVDELKGLMQQEGLIA